MCFLFYLFLFINNQSTLKFFSPHEIPDPFNISIVKLKFIDETIKCRYRQHAKKIPIDNPARWGK